MTQEAGRDRLLNEELRAELLQRVEVEQQLRLELIDKPDDIELITRTIEADAQNTRWLYEVVNQHGWPLKSQVGTEGAKAAFLLVQHSPILEFQKKCLAFMEQALAQGEVDPVDVAYLTDRVRYAEGKPQIYGTQGIPGPDGQIIPAPIEDEKHVDERRTALGLAPMEEYFREINERYRTGK